MRLINKFVISIFFICFTEIFCDVLQCNFHENGFEFNNKNIPGYVCQISYLRPSPPNQPNEIYGNHLSQRNDNDVKFVFYPSFSTEFGGNIQSDLPTICRVFRSLEGVQIRNANTGLVNENLIKDCTNLRLLDFYDNKIREISPNSLDKFLDIKFLSFALNRLTTLPENIFANNKELEILALHRNQISHLPPNIFKPLHKLQILRLHYNKIKTLNSGLFSNLFNLEILEFYNNELSELPTGIFGSLVNLEELRLNKNKLSEIRSESFGIHRRLTHVYLQDNKINAVDERFIDNTAVEELNMQNNVCSRENIQSRNEMKGKLRNCFANFRSRVPTIQINREVCGRSKIGQGNIVGGKFINRGSFPWIAALVRNNGAFFCGATIVSDRKIVTAAHCIQEKHSSSPILARDFKALLGVHDLNERFEVGTKATVVQMIHIHPQWNPKAQSFDADIAVLVTEEKIGFDNYIQPICLVTSGVNIEVTSKGVVVGFGRSEDDSKDHENVPKIVDTPIHGNADCFLDFYELAKLSSRRTFCGGRANGVGVCSGDSGSGLVVLQGGTYYLRGIVSSSLRGPTYGCDVDSYAVFTDVLKFNDWVNGIDVTAGF